MNSPYPGTGIFNDSQKYGIEILDADSITSPGDDYAFVKTKGLSKSDILDAYTLFNEETEKKAVSLIPKISINRARQIFEAHNRFRIDTVWFKLISQYYYNYYNYYGLQATIVE